MAGSGRSLGDTLDEWYRTSYRISCSLQGIAMLRFFSTLLIAVLVSLPALADRDDDVAAFNESWLAYKEAIASGGSSAIIETAGTVVDVGRKIFDDDDERLPILLTNYGRALLAGAQPELARDVLEEALELSEQIHGADAKELIVILEPLGDSVAEAHSPFRQLKHYKRALKIVEQHFGHTSTEYAAVSLRAATRSYELSQSTAGIKYLREAREVFGVVRGEESLEAGIAEYFLAKFEFSNGRHKKVIEYALGALPKLEGDSPELLDLQMYARALLVQAYEQRNMSEEATPHCVAIGRISKLRPKQEHQPLFRMLPRYPAELLMSGIEGHVDFTFTVDENGFVRDPQVITAMQTGRSPRSRSVSDFDKIDRSFEAAALEALERFRYAPVFVDGVATPIENVKTRVSFRIED